MKPTLPSPHFVSEFGRLGRYLSWHTINQTNQLYNQVTNTMRRRTIKGYQSFSSGSSCTSGFMWRIQPRLRHTSSMSSLESPGSASAAWTSATAALTAAGVAKNMAASGFSKITSEDQWLTAAKQAQIHSCHNMLPSRSSSSHQRCRACRASLRGINDLFLISLGRSFFRHR